jgi:hypothetical protein
MKIIQPASSRAADLRTAIVTALEVGPETAVPFGRHIARVEPDRTGFTRVVLFNTDVGIVETIIYRNGSNQPADIADQILQAAQRTTTVPMPATPHVVPGNNRDYTISQYLAFFPTVGDVPGAYGAVKFADSDLPEQHYGVVGFDSNGGSVLMISNNAAVAVSDALYRAGWSQPS